MNSLHNKNGQRQNLSGQHNTMLTPRTPL